VLLFDATDGIGVDGLEDALTRAFEVIRRALDNGEAVVVSLDDRHVQGLGTTGQVAYVHGLVGLVRALAIEGHKPGWHVVALSSTPDVEPSERLRWFEHLGRPGPASGGLVRLGGEHLGRVPV